MRVEDKSPVRIAYERRNRDLDPQLVWRGKDEQDWSDLVVAAPPLYIQEKVHPKVIIDELKRQSKARAKEKSDAGPDLFADFNGLRDKEAATEFYQHDQHWSNRMILGDSLSVMASLAEREGLRGKVQCIYFDPPYGIKFNSNFQWSTTSRDVKDGAKDHITREPEQVRAFRDTWRDGIHSYLAYLRDRLTVARDLLTESGSIFVQIGDENVHRVRALMDEVFGDNNFISEITFKTSSGFETRLIANVFDRILWYGRHQPSTKYRQLFDLKAVGADTYFDEIQMLDGTTLPASENVAIPDGGKYLFKQPLISSGDSGTLGYNYIYRGVSYHCGPNRHWKTSHDGMRRLANAQRIHSSAKTLKFKRFHDDYPVSTIDNHWADTVSLISKNYVVETIPRVVERCLLMTTDPGDLVLDPTCGSGTTAYVAEQWGRRWITIDTSRVSLALARSRIMGARYPYYLLADSPEGQRKEAEVTRSAPKTTPTRGDIRQGFVYERVPHITLKSIANNKDIDVLWETWQQVLEPLRERLNTLVSSSPGSSRGSPKAAGDGRTSPAMTERVGEMGPAGRSGKSRVRLHRPGPQPRRRPTPSGGRPASRGRRRSTPRSRRAPSSNISMTSPIRTIPRCAWRGPSRWRACRPTARWPSMPMTS